MLIVIAVQRAHVQIASNVIILKLECRQAVPHRDGFFSGCFLRHCVSAAHMCHYIAGYAVGLINSETPYTPEFVSYFMSYFISELQSTQPAIPKTGKPLVSILAAKM